jgi:hypothetical protein
MEFRLPSFMSTAVAQDFSPNVGATVSDFVAALQRVSAHRTANRSAAQASATRAHALGADGCRCEASIPDLPSGFGFFAWQG